MSTSKPQLSLSEIPLWKLAIRLMIPFSITLIFVMIVLQLVSKGNLNAMGASFKDGSWINYLLSKTFIVVVYGFVMAYFTKRKANKK